MQAQPQLSGQTSRQMSGQLSGPSQNMNSMSSRGGNRRTWHTESDVGTRRMIAERIFLLFEKRKPQLSPELQQRLPEMVKRFEELLYHDASSKEEYADLSTLEQRLVKQGQMRNNHARGVNSMSSSMIPTSGMSSSVNGSGSTMIPTPGTININSSGFGHMVPPSTTTNLQGHGLTSMTNPSRMVPTPGINSNMLTSAESSAVNAGSSAMSGPAQQLQYDPRSGGFLHRNVTGQLGGNTGYSMQRKYPYINGNVSNGSLNFPNPPMYAAPHFGNSPQRIHQHRQHVPIQSRSPSHLTANSTESTSSESFCNSTSKPSDSLNIQAQEFQASRMIPVPGLPSQLSSVQVQKQIQQIRSQTDKSLGIDSQKQTVNFIKNQQETEPIKPRMLHQVAYEKEPVLGSPTCSSSSLQSLPNEEKPQTSKVLDQEPLSISSDHTNAGRNQPSQENCKGYLDKHSDAEQRTQQFSPQSLPEDHQRKQQLDRECQESVTQQTMEINTNESQQKCDPVLNGSSHEAENGTSTSVVASTAGSMLGKPSPSGILDPQRAQQYLKQQRWLLFLRHASKCTAHEGQCQSTPHCHLLKQLWMHISKCNDRDCQYARCQHTRALLRHHRNCRDAQCPVCVPVRHKIAMQHMQASETSVSFSKTMVGASTSMDAQMPPAKKAKHEPGALVVPNVELNQESLPHMDVAKVEIQAAASMEGTNEQTNSNVKKELLSSFTDLGGTRSHQVLSEPVVDNVPIEEEPSNIVLNKTTKQEIQHEKVVSSVADLTRMAKPGKPKIKGVSLTELFTPEQIKDHIVGLRQWVGQSKAKAEKNQAMEHRMSESSCQLCAVETLTFEPPPIYCTPCGIRIKRNAFYWTMQIGETRHYICVPCYNDPRTDTVDIDGITHSKSKLEKRKNDEETDEPWVQCDKCEKWQHQVCALFNMRRNEGGQAEYTCPHCLIGEIQRGERKPLPQSAVLGAKDLPRTLLSDHIEQRLFKKLKEERMQRARTQGKSFDEVPGADSLVIRIVSSVDKKLEVKQRFLEMFQNKDYSTEFPYKSKVLLLFQKIEGVEVCLFGMYVQEFGVEAAQPNQRRVYLSYLDSVKYFRPDVKTVNGEALRTFVYHEILIGYLDYCKKRGFTSCYIWACPPLKGEDYILYCHPEIQKTPKSDKLREWYLSMLRKASDENIVVELTNMYDHFFVCAGERKAKVTAARLPYFDGDYWPGAAEDMIMQLQEEEVGEKQQKRGKTKKTATKRAAKAPAQFDFGNNASKDLQLMQKLGATIYPMKEDFIMVHLQFCCTHCCNFILSGRRWVCKQCQAFQLCDRCYDAEQKRDERERHSSSSKELHSFAMELTEPVNDTRDKDEILESEFFDTRQAFLSLCQGNHYQYDTLRRAKHSSMMVLYHLHNPTAPAFVTTCNICHRDIETGHGWRCETCPDFDLCNSCYSNGDSTKHPHKLSPHPSAADRETQSKEARQQRVLQLRKMLDLLVHASQCGSPHCLYPNCRRVKGLFRHGIACKVRASGGCHLCKKMWYLLQLHARACKESECRVPRCKDLKEHLRRLQHQMESRRRAAVNEMMRQRAAETAAGMR